MGKSKSIYGVNYSIGATVIQPDAPQPVKIVPDNRTLIVLPLSDTHDTQIQPERLRSLPEIFEKYQPSREVEFKNVDGETEDPVNLEFRSLKDFTKEGIVSQVKMLQELEANSKLYARFADIFQNNDKLRMVLANEDSKKDLLELIDTLIEELS